MYCCGNLETVIEFPTLYGLKSTIDSQQVGTNSQKNFLASNKKYTDIFRMAK